MILKSLYDYAQANSNLLPPPGMEWKEIEFVIVIDSEGNFKRFESKRIDKKRCERFLVAKTVKRASAPISNILWDNG
ncbi:MAG: type I-C CRISPR-associated protein Cas8c/Csd1, partial [Muribaculaceae bacterium]|nr:type I-C CRISPR-associated protein Cas8c/Csd1 [Muribaculaceae bacterium]